MSIKTLRTLILGFGWSRGLKLPALPQHRVSKPAASRLQAREPCAPVWKMQRVAFRLPSLEFQKKVKKYLCSPLAFTLLQLFKSEVLALYVIFSSGKQSVELFFFRLPTVLKWMQYFLLHLLESSVAHRRPLISRRALALGRKGATAPTCALQRSQTAWVPKADVGPSIPP